MTLCYTTLGEQKTIYKVKINEDLNSLSQWLNNNLLTLNYEKTKFMVFASKKQSTKVDITIENKKVLQETSFNYLGVTLSSDLTWHNHINNMIAKINQRLGVLQRVKEFLDLDTRCVLYTFDYGDTIWGDKNNSILMNSLQVFENKAVKIILNQQPRYSSTKALEELKWTTLTTRRHNHRCTFIYKCMNGLIDFDFELTKNEDVHGHNTRHRRDLHLPRAKTNKGKQRPTYQASNFNNLEHELKNATSLYNFKKLLKRRCVYEV